MTLNRLRWTPVLPLTVWLAAGALAEPPLLYLPFDGSARPAISAAPVGSGAGLPAPELSFVPGLRDRAARVTADCRLPAAGHLDPAAGTVAFWLRPAWAGSDPVGRTLFCLYGADDRPEPWLHNRWSIICGGGRLQAWLWGQAPEQRLGVTADVATWQAGQWHHVAITWQGVNSGRADAALTLFVDGRQAATQGGQRVDVGPVAQRLDVGRDSDGSPDYAEADYDDLYVYGQALPAEAIAKAVALAGEPPTGPVAAAASGQARPDWWNDAWRYRCAVRARLPATVAGPVPGARLSLDVQTDLVALGLAAMADPESVRLLPCDPRTGATPPGATPLPATIEDGALVWALPEGTAPGTVAAAWLYLGTVDLDTSLPLFARPARQAWPQTPAKPTAVAPDYARDTYGDAWDFDEDDTEAIDQWGNKPEFLRDRQVKDGVLSFRVTEDPWFIWGNMWGQVEKSERPLAIDLARYPILRLRVRQSCSDAEWSLYGRVGTSTDLLTHAFRVTGSGWQTLRIDLRNDAHWGGVLSAFRIDPTSKIAAARVEIDWVRLTNETAAERGPLEYLGPAATPPPARVELAVADPRQQAGTRQALTVRAVDAQGRPVAGWPVTVRLQSSSDGTLAQRPGCSTLALGPTARRGIGDAKGELVVDLVAGRRAAPKGERLQVSADFAAAAAAALTVPTVAGPPHHYELTPGRPLVVAPDGLPLEVSAQLVDETGNALPVAGRQVTFTASAGATVVPAVAATDAQGRTTARLRLDAARAWVCRVEARDGDGLTGRSQPVTLRFPGPRPDPIRRLPNGYFADAAGRPFVPLGGFYANWVQAETPDGEWSKLRSFTDTTDEEKLTWMQFLARNGVTAMRFMLRTHRPTGMEPMDIGGAVNPGLFADAVRYLDLAREPGLRFQLVVHEDYTKPVYVNETPIRQYSLPWYSAAELDGLPPYRRRFLRDLNLLSPAGLRYTDADAIACQDDYARELVTALAGNPQVFAYELENEMVSCPASWANHAADVIRAADEHVLVGVSHGGGGLHTADPLWWHRKVRLDYYNYHLYPHGGPTSEQTDYGAAVDVLTRYGRLAGVCYLGEAAGDQFGQHPDRDTRRWVMRDIIWMALTNGNPGVFFWNARASEVAEFRPAHDAMAQLDLATFRRAKPEIGIDVGHPVDDDLYYRSQAGGQDYARMGQYAQHYLSLGVETDFTLEPKAYAKSCSLAEFAPPEPSVRPFRTGPGWQLKYLARDDWRQALVYVRNLAGIQRWDSREGQGVWTQYLRTRKPVALSVALDLPAGAAFEVTAYDLDSQTVHTQSLAAGATLDLGTTDHDFALVLRRP